VKTTKLKQRSLTNDEAFAAFWEWRYQFKGPNLSEEEIERGISTIRRFAEFIHPKGLAQSTVAEIKEFCGQFQPKTLEEEITLESIEPLMTMDAFRRFVSEVIRGKKSTELIDKFGRPLYRRIYHLSLLDFDGQAALAALIRKKSKARPKTK